MAPILGIKHPLFPAFSGNQRPPRRSPPAGPARDCRQSDFIGSRPRGDRRQSDFIGSRPWRDCRQSVARGADRGGIAGNPPGWVAVRSASAPAQPIGFPDLGQPVGVSGTCDPLSGTGDPLSGTGDPPSGTAVYASGTAVHPFPTTVGPSGTSAGPARPKGCSAGPTGRGLRAARARSPFSERLGRGMDRRSTEVARHLRLVHAQRGSRWRPNDARRVRVTCRAGVRGD